MGLLILGMITFGIFMLGGALTGVPRILVIDFGFVLVGVHFTLTVQSICRVDDVSRYVTSRPKDTR